MTEINREVPRDIMKPEEILVDAYHPLSLHWDEGWELVRLRNDQWQFRKASMGLSREKNPQIGCG